MQVNIGLQIVPTTNLQQCHFDYACKCMSPSSVGLEWKYNSPTNNKKIAKIQDINTKNTHQEYTTSSRKNQDNATKILQNNQKASSHLEYPEDVLYKLKHHCTDNFIMCK